MADTVELPTPQEHAAEPWRKLGTIPTTNLKTVFGLGVTAATAVHYFAMAWTGRDVRMNAMAWDSWLFFLATAVLTVNAATYVAKRVTYKPGAPDAARGASATPTPEAEAERDRAAAVETARATAEQPVVVGGAQVVSSDPAATLDALQAEYRRRQMATVGLGGAAGGAPFQPPGQGD